MRSFNAQMESKRNKQMKKLLKMMQQVKMIKLVIMRLRSVLGSWEKSDLGYQEFLVSVRLHRTEVSLRLYQDTQKLGSP